MFDNYKFVSGTTLMDKGGYFILQGELGEEEKFKTFDHTTKYLAANDFNARVFIGIHGSPNILMKLMNAPINYIFC